MLTVILKLIISIVFGSIIGYEREKEHKAAGLRTCILVTFAMTLLIILNQELNLFFGGHRDVLRLPAYCLLSIGFLGGGIIRQAKHHTEGVTTACLLLVLVGIGIAVGVEKYLLGGIVSVFTFGILKLKSLERWYKNRSLKKQQKKIKEDSINKKYSDSLINTLNLIDKMKEEKLNIPTIPKTPLPPKKNKKNKKVTR